LRLQTLITSVNYREADELGKKQILGTFMFDHVKLFID